MTYLTTEERLEQVEQQVREIAEVLQTTALRLDGIAEALVENAKLVQRLTKAVNTRRAFLEVKE